jgi:hypothetical protein
MIVAEDERELLKVADQVSTLLVAARNRCGGQGKFLVVHKSWHAVKFSRMMRRSHASLMDFLF